MLRWPFYVTSVHSYSCLRIGMRVPLGPVKGLANLRAVWSERRYQRAGLIAATLRPTYWSVAIQNLVYDDPAVSEKRGAANALRCLQFCDMRSRQPRVG